MIFSMFSIKNLAVTFNQQKIKSSLSNGLNKRVKLTYHEVTYKRSDRTSPHKYILLAFKKTTRKATDFKSPRINCWEINQVTSKCQMDFLEKTRKKGLKQKEEDHRRILLYNHLQSI